MPKMVKIYRGGLEFFTDHEVDLVANELTNQRDVDLCFEIKLDPIKDNPAILKADILGKIRQKLTATRAPTYVTDSTLIETGNYCERGLWVHLAAGNDQPRTARTGKIVQAFYAGGPEIIYGHEMKAFATDYWAGATIILDFIFDVPDGQAIYDQAAATRGLLDKLQQAGIKDYGIVFVTVDQAPINGHQRVRVTINHNPTRK